MIEDKLGKHFQADALPDGHPVRDACDELRNLRYERDALRAERDALLADARRYRYLRNRNPNEVLTSRGLAAGLWIDRENSSGTLTLVTGDDADNEIDEALAKEPK
jgi:hypothetical protein